MISYTMCKHLFHQLQLHHFYGSGWLHLYHVLLSQILFTFDPLSNLFFQITLFFVWFLICCSVMITYQNSIQNYSVAFKRHFRLVCLNYMLALKIKKRMEAWSGRASTLNRKPFHFYHIIELIAMIFDLLDAS